MKVYQKRFKPRVPRLWKTPPPPARMRPQRARLRWTPRLPGNEAVLREDGLTMEIRTEGIEALIKEALDETQH